jgi:heme/copper-type cytochrome/quinol oxidase subunit 2
VLVAQGVPQNLVIFDPRNPEQEMEIMLLGLAVVVLLIVATVLVTGWFWITVLKRRSRA